MRAFSEEPQSPLQILSPLHRATAEDDVRRVIELLAAGADVNEKATDGRTPLHVCAQANNTVMAEVLLYKSASIEVVDDVVRFAKSLADRKVKIPVASSEQAKEIGPESDPDVQATHTQPDIRSLEEAGKSELVQGFETPTKREENY